MGKKHAFKKCVHFHEIFMLPKYLKNEYINLLFIVEAKYFMNYNCTKLYFDILYTYIIFREMSEFRKSQYSITNEWNTNQN